MSTADIELYDRLRDIMAVQAAEMQAALDRIVATRIPGMPMSADSDFFLNDPNRRARRDLWALTVRQTYHIAANIVDHVRAGAVLLGLDERPIYAHATIARVALEGATRIRHILDPTAGPELRLARGLAFMIESGQEEVKATRDIPATPFYASPAQAISTNFASFLATIENTGITISRTKNNRPTAVAVGAATATVGVTMTELMKARYPQLPAVYRLTSGAIHSMPHILDDNAWMTGPSTMRWGGNPIHAGASVITLLTAVRVLLNTFAAYHGIIDDTAVRDCVKRLDDVDTAMRDYVRTIGHGSVAAA